MKFGNNIDRFDRLCKVIEHLAKSAKGKNSLEFMDKIMKLTQYGKLFVFEQRAIDIELEEFTQDKADDFRLPFPAMIVSDLDSIIMVEDSQKDAAGIKAKRFFVDCADIDHHRGLMTSITAAYIEDAYIDSQTGNFVAQKIVDPHNWMTDGRQVWQSNNNNDKERIELLMNDYVRNVIASVEEISLLNSPANFVFESKPRKIRQPKKNKIPRSHERKHFTLLAPNVIRDIMKVENQPEGVDSGEKVGHDRRGHYRTLRSDFYKNRQGEKIWIDPVWVGPQESVIGNRTYRVRLDV